MCASPPSFLPSPLSPDLPLVPCFWTCLPLPPSPPPPPFRPRRRRAEAGEGDDESFVLPPAARGDGGEASASGRDGEGGEGGLPSPDGASAGTPKRYCFTYSLSVRSINRKLHRVPGGTVPFR